MVLQCERGRTVVVSKQFQSLCEFCRILKASKISRSTSHNPESSKAEKMVELNSSLLAQKHKHLKKKKEKTSPMLYFVTSFSHVEEIVGG